ncbi:DUF429 domain-containing protein [Mesorhizobium qingshengii]|uniref:DUF429 domain-containing protein n=1 Tax=Mesorhizobium qingshengii TaxID=1165689 RepID=A0ABT4R0M8_9HYPH|nr:DUF429 domain-containing protein [Mesorhizobium qingshengii]MCZ8547309.1 DUF429 domain-containing protein [Mesorhizobium qingshengii]
MIALGFDPGGAKGFGCCLLAEGSFTTATVGTIAEAMRWAVIACAGEAPSLAGIDTLLHWSDGPSGWRRADLCLKGKYPGASASVMSPNSLFGAMAVGGVGLAIRLKEQWPMMAITETHPKVLFHALHGANYAKSEIAAAFDWFVDRAALSPGSVRNEHELDALISAWAAKQGTLQQWSDLCEPRTQDMIFPAGPVSYLWPPADLK